MGKQLVTGPRKYKGFTLSFERFGSSSRWRVYNAEGRQVDRVGFKSLAAAKRDVNDVLRLAGHQREVREAVRHGPGSS